MKYQNASNFTVSSKFPTKSNVNLKVINNVLHRYSLKLLPGSPYKAQLNKLLKFRNNIAHGDNSIPVDRKNVIGFSLAINDLMVEIFLRIEEGYAKNTFRR
ncbi:MAG: hypothetical protein GY862_06980 [Gammaproteobacteria bacterium]|nr:hypothetical protein [Gammaproteobacteria bacterium]